jgi:hypothetical protein
MGRMRDAAPWQRIPQPGMPPVYCYQMSECIPVTCRSSRARASTGTIAGMSEEQKPQIWPWIAAPTILVPALYVASFGPACALVDYGKLPPCAFKTTFGPCLHLAVGGPWPLPALLQTWADAWDGGGAIENEQFDRVRQAVEKVYAEERARDSR